jgi:hypothetical protein
VGEILHEPTVGALNASRGESGEIDGTVLLEFAEAHLKYYRARRNRNRNTHFIVEVLLVGVTAGTTVAAALNTHDLVTTMLASITLVLTGLRQIFQPRERWVSCGVSWGDLDQAIMKYKILT